MIGAVMTGLTETVPIGLHRDGPDRSPDPVPIGLTETAAAGPLLAALGLCVLAGLVSFARRA